DRIRGLGNGKLENYIENYFPHLWANVGKAGSVIESLRNSKRGSMTGSSNFLKARDHETFVAGIGAGLEPITYNPIKQVLLRLHEMDRYIAGHEMLQDAVDMNHAKWLPEKAGRNTPES